MEWTKQTTTTTTIKNWTGPVSSHNINTEYQIAFSWIHLVYKLLNGSMWCQVWKIQQQQQKEEEEELYFIYCMRIIIEWKCSLNALSRQRKQMQQFERQPKFVPQNANNDGPMHSFNSLATHNMRYNWIIFLFARRRFSFFFWLFCFFSHVSSLYIAEGFVRTIKQVTLLFFISFNAHNNSDWDESVSNANEKWIICF